MTKRIWTGIFSALGILLMILDGKTAMGGAVEGIELCMQSVIPSIFPFLVLSGLLAASISGAGLRILEPLGRLLGIPKGSEGIFLTGLVGGYPTGAQAVYSAWKEGRLDTVNARRMLGFCSNAGPSFLFGILASAFPNVWMLWLLWVIHILSVVLTAVILPTEGDRGNVTLTKRSLTISQALKNGVVTMGQICGWIILFRILLAFAQRWFLWLLPVQIRVAVYGVLELANGCCALTAISSTGLRFVTASAMLAFGGICVAMQTVTVTGELGTGKYFPGKVMQTLISILLSGTAQILIMQPSERWDHSVQVMTLTAVLAALVAFWQRRPKKGVAFFR